MVQDQLLFSDSSCKVHSKLTFNICSDQQEHDNVQTSRAATPEQDMEVDVDAGSGNSGKSIN